MVVSAVTERREVVFRNENGTEAVASLDALDALDRRRMFTDGPGGLEPAMAWLSETGMPMPYNSWQTVFRMANERCVEQGVDIRVYPHMLRHSFALRWLVTFMHAFDRRFGLTPQQREEFRKAFGDPYVMVQMLLGHRSSETTRRIYLEPAQGLQIDLFLRGDDGAIASPDDLLAVMAQTSDRVKGLPR